MFLFLLQNLSNLKVIDLSYSKNLVQMPDLSLAQNLERMEFRNCSSLCQAPLRNFLNFDRLTYVDMRRCDKLLDLPNSFFSRSLAYLNLEGCRSIRNIPVTKGKVVRFLNLCGTSIATLPASFVSFYKLSILKLEDCRRLKNLPS